MHFPLLDGKKSNPSHEFANDRKNHGCTVQYIHVRPWHDDRLTQFAFENKPEVKPIE